MREPGFYDDVPEAEYHDDDESLSVSGAKLLLRAPALYLYRQDHPERRDEFDIGSAAHKLVLGIGPELYDVGLDGYEDWRKAEARELRDELREQHETIALLPKDYKRVHEMADELRHHAFAMKLLEGTHELSAYAFDDATGILRRGRLDCLGDGAVSDYKTTLSAEPSAFATSVARFGYDMQAAWYLDLLDDLGEHRDAFAFVAQEKEPPYLVEVFEIDELSLERGRRRNRRALDIFARCLESDDWPGYTGELFTTLSVPSWALREEGL